MDNSIYMNVPVPHDFNAADVAREYMRIGDKKKVAKVFNLDIKQINVILKDAGITIEKRKKLKNDSLEEIGMNQKDFL